MLTCRVTLSVKFIQHALNFLLLTRFRPSRFPTVVRLRADLSWRRQKTGLIMSPCQEQRGERAAACNVQMQQKALLVWESPSHIWSRYKQGRSESLFFFFRLHLSPQRGQYADKNTTREGEEILKQMKTGTQKELEEQYLYLHERERFATSKSLMSVEVCDEDRFLRRFQHIQHLFTAQNYFAGASLEDLWVVDASCQDNPFTQKLMQDLSIDSLFLYNHTFISFWDAPRCCFSFITYILLDCSGLIIESALLMQFYSSLPLKWQRYDHYAGFFISHLTQISIYIKPTELWNLNKSEVGGSKIWCGNLLWMREHGNKKGCGLAELMPPFNTSQDEKVAGKLCLQEGRLVVPSVEEIQTDACVLKKRIKRTEKHKIHTFCIFTAQFSKCPLPLGHHGTPFLQERNVC